MSNATASSPVIEAFTATQILAMPTDEPGRVFQPDLDAIDRDFKRLAKLWHPDRNRDAKAGNVFAHLQKLRDAAKAAVANGNWRAPGILELTAIDGKAYRLRYRKKHEFELGEFYIGAGVVAYAVKPEFRDLFDNAVRLIRNFSFADDKMREGMKSSLPQYKAHFETADQLLLVCGKDADQVLLADLVTQQGGKLDPKHAAWVISRLSNISCYLQYAGLTHNAIGLDSVLVSPATHSASLVGGWWYGAKAGENISALPDQSLAVLPPDILTTKRADSRLDLELIRAAGRTMLGDPIGTKLRHDKDVPRPLAEWLTLPPTGTAVENYRAWQVTVLPQSFGPRRFVKLNVGFEDVYPQP